MFLTHINIISVIDDCLSDYRMVLKELKGIRMDTPVTRDRLEQLNGIIIRTPEDDIAAIMDFVVKEEVSPERVGSRLKEIITCFTDILREKTRILSDTPQIFKDMGGMTGMN